MRLMGYYPYKNIKTFVMHMIFVIQLNHFRINKRLNRASHKMEIDNHL